MNKVARPARRASAKTAIRTAVETLECRRLLTDAYQAIPFAEDWTDTSRITTTVNTPLPVVPPNTAGWENVPGFVGYRGDDLVVGTGANAQAALVPGDTSPNNIFANQLNPDTTFSGGVAEFEIANPVVGLNGSGTADAPSLQLHLNSTGVPIVRVSYLLRDVDNSTDNSVQQVALQYRVGTSGDFINVPSAFVADASAGPTATLETPVVATLPAEAGNQAQLQVRWLTTNAPGNDEWIGIDNISVTAGNTAGTLNLSSASFSTTEDAGSREITITRSDGSTGAVSVRALTILGGTATAGSDYTAVDQVVNFANGQTSATFNIPVLNLDTTPEPVETVFIQLSDVTGGASIGATASATLFIGDDDTTAPEALVLNELNVNPGGTDNPFEYGELRGTGGTTLFNTYFVSIEGDSVGGQNPGNISFIQELSNFQVGTSGYLIVQADTGGHAVPSGTTIVPVSTLRTANGGALQNGSNTFAVIHSQTPLRQGFDLDVDNDGTIDSGLQGYSFVDGLGFNDFSDIGDKAYGNAVVTLDTLDPNLPTVTFRDGAPDIATRFPTELAANDANAWYYGEPFQGTGASNASLEYAPGANPGTFAVQTLNPNGVPAGQPLLTPGAVNYPSVPGDVVPPTLDARMFAFDESPTPQTVRLTFSEDVSASLDISDITLTNLTTSSTVSSASLSLNYNTGTNVASITAPGFAAGVLPDGIYELSITGLVEDPAGNDLVATTPFNFFALAADANRDRSVNLDDFTVLANNFGLPGRTFSTGDFNYDTNVNLDDFTILANQFGKTLPASPASLPRTSPAAGAFSNSLISAEEIKPIRDDVIV